MAHAAQQSELPERSATRLAQEIANGTISSLEAVEAHIARIEAVNARVNAVIVPMFDQARREARAADEARRSGKELGLLHGVPITVKECFHVAGTPSCIGVDRLKHELAEHDGQHVARLRRAGAIILGKTNLPQLMLLHESDNPVYGLTVHPENDERSPGGSSGGEAAIVATGGSPLGLANDVGGSIRQPAHSCGICGIKPTSGRITNAGSRNTLPGMEAIVPAPGFLARSVDDLYLGLRALNPLPGEHEPDEFPVPLGDPAQADVSKLRIGMVLDDGFFPASPAIRRGVREAEEMLRTAGATVEPFELLDGRTAVRLFVQLASGDGGKAFRDLLGSSTRDWRIKRLLRIAALSGPVRSTLIAGLITAGQPRLADLVRWVGRSSARQFWERCHERSQYIRRFYTAMTERRLDGLILPPHALPALRHGGSMDLPFSASYCLAINVLGWPCGAVPVTRVRLGEESDRPASRDIVMRAAALMERGSAGLPVGVQVVGMPWREDVVLAVMRAIEQSAVSKHD